jgi:hypothetical protein
MSEWKNAGVCQNKYKLIIIRNNYDLSNHEWSKGRQANITITPQGEGGKEIGTSKPVKLSH